MFIFNIYLLMVIGLVFGKEITEPNNNYDFDLADLLGLGEDYLSRPKRQPSLANSALQFLLELYNDINENEADLDHVREHLAYNERQRRALRDENFITDFDRKEIENCNNIITFASKQIANSSTNLITDIPIVSDMKMGFNTNNVPCDLQLVRSALRVYQQPSLGKYAQNSDNQNATITLYRRKMYRKEYTGDLIILTSINTTTNYSGWLEFNTTRLLNRWLRLKSYQSVNINELIVGVSLNTNNTDRDTKTVDILASDLGLIKPSLNEEMIDLQPFIIGYFNGPEWITKMQKLRFKRDMAKRKRTAIPFKQYTMPETCERVNFTLDFKDIGMDKWVLAPKKFEAYFCAGGCNFPLGSKTNATNHAIVQTLIHLQKSTVPKPCCVPTILGSIMVLLYLNDDSNNLQIYPQSVALECGCH